MKDNEIFKTTDLPLATFLKCNQIPLNHDKPYDPISKEWVFEEKMGCNGLVADLANGKAEVKVLEYEMHRKNLLSIAKRYSKGA
jgi:hypothetical protein